jgi:mRNA interferase MazF
VKRGEIWEIEFPLTTRENSEPILTQNTHLTGRVAYGHGLAVIVSSDAFNQSAIRTVMIAVLTSNIKLARAPGNVLLLKEEIPQLATDSVINISQVLVVDKTRLLEFRAVLDFFSLELLNLGLKRVFDLT